MTKLLVVSSTTRIVGVLSLDAALEFMALILFLLYSVKKRVCAGRLLLAGKSLAEVAKRIEAARQTVYTWKARIDGFAVRRYSLPANAF
ncbi:MAG TPA: helix-turn-helix domain-containing protein [Burkholderiales bacterium]|nr:helix-turn-helix domain-containing protein [Burkholderiales bacterium]